MSEEDPVKETDKSACKPGNGQYERTGKKRVFFPFQMRHLRDELLSLVYGAGTAFRTDIKMRRASGAGNEAKRRRFCSFPNTNMEGGIRASPGNRYGKTDNPTVLSNCTKGGGRD